MKRTYTLSSKILLCVLTMYTLSYGITFEEAFTEAVRQNDFKQMKDLFRHRNVTENDHYKLFQKSFCNAECVRALKILGASPYLKGGTYVAEMAAAKHLDDAKIKALAGRYPGVSTIYNNCYAGNTPSHIVAARLSEIILDEEASQKAFNILVDLRINLASKNHQNATPKDILLIGLIGVCTPNNKFTQQIYNPEACARYAQFLLELEMVLKLKSPDKNDI